MTNLILAICSSAAISLIMRFSSDRISNNVSMLAVNYLTCLGLAAFFTGGGFFPKDAALPGALGMGIVHGILYLASFVTFQRSVSRSGVVLSAIFMKLGLLVPMVISIFLFREIPGRTQIIGFCLAVAAIILINFEKNTAASASAPGLVILLLLGGSADAMSKVFEELGPGHLSEQFLLYTFLTAFALCMGLVFLKKQHFTRWELLFGFAVGIPNFFSARFLLGALESLAAVIVYPTYSVATILLITLAGTMFFREQLKKHQWAALSMILLALVLLNV
jgi:multidrug transporter EmrE-like cation transporter